VDSKVKITNNTCGMCFQTELTTWIKTSFFESYQICTVSQNTSRQIWLQTYNLSHENEATFSHGLQ